jgi:hypothetical protein
LAAKSGLCIIHGLDEEGRTVKPRRQRNLLAALALASILVLAMILIGLGTKSTFAPGRVFSHDPLPDFPKLILWAWERPEDLRFIDPRQVGVAFLARTLYLRGEQVVVRPRLQPLSVPDGTALMAVVRIEPERFEPPTLSPQQQADASRAIAELADLPGTRAVQVDFDARVSERAFYRELLKDLRRQLPESVPLSITALASWCIHDTWISDLPVDEAVPMLFRMGVDHRQVFIHLESGGDFRPAICRTSLGISTDEPLPKLPSSRRVYVFHPQAWSPEDVHQVIEEVRRWQ